MRSRAPGAQTESLHDSPLVMDKKRQNADKDKALLTVKRCGLTVYQWHYCLGYCSQCMSTNAVQHDALLYRIVIFIDLFERNSPVVKGMSIGGIHGQYSVVILNRFHKLALKHGYTRSFCQRERWLNQREDSQRGDNSVRAFSESSLEGSTEM